MVRLIAVLGNKEFFGDKQLMQDISMAQFLDTLIYQTTYFLICVQSLCFLLLFGKYHAKWRDICTYLLLLVAQCIFININDPFLSIPNLNILHYICFVLSLFSFVYLMWLLYLISKSKNTTNKNSKKDFLYLVIFIALSFIIITSKVVYDLV